MNNDIPLVIYKNPTNSQLYYKNENDWTTHIIDMENGKYKLKFKNIELKSLDIALTDETVFLIIDGTNPYSLIGNNIKIEDIVYCSFNKCKIDTLLLAHDMEFSIEHCDILNLSVRKMTINHAIEINRHIEHIDLDNVHCKEDVDICLWNEENRTSKKQIYCNIKINECHFETKFKIRNCENGRTYEEYQHNKAILNEFKIKDCTLGNNAYFRIGFLDVQNFSLQNLRLPSNSELNIGDCYFKNFTLSNFRNTGIFKLYKINILNKEKEAKCFTIDNTSIGEAHFQSIDLTLFQDVYMFDNIFNNLVYTNVQWKKEIEVNQFQNDDSKMIKKQDTYRVLKNVAIKNNDQPQALTLYAQEMEEYKKIIDKTDSFVDKTILKFNSGTNDFGLNWRKPIVLLVIVSIFFYMGLLYSLNIPIFISEHWEKFFAFVNPTHKVEFIAQEYWTISSYAIDIVYRIIEGLLIYQAIVAFRKYTMKL